MGTGPFKFVEHVKGSHWVGKKNPDYWDKGKPYLDGFRAIFIRDPRPRRWRPSAASARTSSSAASARPSATASCRRSGNKITVQESPWDCILLVGMQPREEALRRQARAPRAHAGARPLRGLEVALASIAVVKEVAGVQVPGTPYATPPAELEKLAGYGRDIDASRAPRRGACCKEAGVPEGFSFTFKNRGIPHALRAARHLADRPVAPDRAQRQAGGDRGRRPTHAMLKRGDFEVAMDFQCGFIVEPDLDIAQVPVDRRTPTPTTAATRTRCSTTSTTSRRAPSTPRSASSSCAQFEKRLLDEEAHYIYDAAVAPHRPAQRQGAGLDDHAEPLPEQPARHGLAPE